MPSQPPPFFFYTHPHANQPDTGYSLQVVLGGRQGGRSHAPPSPKKRQQLPLSQTSSFPGFLGLSSCFVTRSACPLAPLEGERTHNQHLIILNLVFSSSSSTLSFPHHPQPCLFFIILTFASAHPPHLLFSSSSSPLSFPHHPYLFPHLIVSSSSSPQFSL